MNKYVKVSFHFGLVRLIQKEQQGRKDRLSNFVENYEPGNKQIAQIEK